MSDNYGLLARKAQDHIQERIAKGHRYVTYGDLNTHLGVDRFTGQNALGRLVEINTEEGKPLWSAFVGYSDCRYGMKGWPGGAFYDCARDLGWEVSRGIRFAVEQREACRKLIE